MTRKTTIVSTLFFITFFVLTSGAKTKDYIEDPYYLKGLALSPIDPAIVEQGHGFAATNTDTLRFFGNSKVPPFWQIAQWYSKYDLAHSPLTKTKYGYTHTNQGKSISVSKNGVLTLEIKTGNEYTVPRTTENWPHLLIQHDFTTPINLSAFRDFILSFSMRLLYCQNRMSAAEYNSGLHTAQSPFYLMLRNTNKTSPDYGNQVWFGVASFDYRDTTLAVTPKVTWDIGTSTYIYQLPPRMVWGNILFTDCRWHSCKVDILTMIQNAIIFLQRQNLFKNTTIKDLQVTHMNFGWECPGTFDAAVQVKNFSLKARPIVP
jgi:hypothetical protein